MLAPWKESCDKPRQHIKKQRYQFSDKGPYIQSYGFSSNHVRMSNLDHKEGWHWRIDVFELWCWTRCLRVPGTVRSSNQSILKDINPEYSLEGLMLKLKLQSFGHLMRRADSLEKTLILGKIEGRRRRDYGNLIRLPNRLPIIRGGDGWMASLIQWTWTWAKFWRWSGTGRPGVLQSIGLQSRDWLCNWTTIKIRMDIYYIYS